MADLNVLSDADVAILKRFIAQEKNTLQNTSSNDTGSRPSAGSEITMGSPEVYVAMPPCGSGIPPRQGTKPGAAICCVFAIEINPGDFDVATQEPNVPTNRILTPVLNPDGSQLRRTVYNTHNVAIFGEYVNIHRSAYGRWLASHVAGEQSTTTPSGTTTTPYPPDQQCDGRCLWYWQEEYEGAAGFWTLQLDSCNVGTTSTTQAPGSCSSGQVAYQCVQGQWVYVSDTCPSNCSAGGAPSGSCSGPEEGTVQYAPCTENSGGGGQQPPGSSSGDCLCPGDGEPVYTTAPPTPPTTQAPECHCLYPDYCGTYQSESTETQCSEYETDPPAECPPSTTTTTIGPTTTTTACDCNTTTTSDPTSCEAGCDWFLHPLQGWVATRNDCSSSCPCAAPPAGSVDGPCSSVRTGCVPLPPPPPPPPPPTCSGSCSWVWIPPYAGYDGHWVLTSNGCTSGAGWCSCQAPSQNGNDCGQITVTQCVRPTTTAAPTTTPGPGGPCDECYPPSTTLPPTTTPCPPCTLGCEECVYVNSQECGVLILREDQCTGDCGCPEDLPVEGPSGTTVKKPCVADPPAPPTSTTSTSATPTTCSPCDLIAGPSSAEPGTCGSCLWRWSAECGDWVLVEDGCHGASSCPCPAPEPVDPANTGSGNPYHARIPWTDGYSYPVTAFTGNTLTSYCESTTTTAAPPTSTTTSCPSSTTAPPVGFCCTYTVVENGPNTLLSCQALTEFQCAYRDTETENSVWHSGPSAVNCDVCDSYETTTTGQPTTTECPSTTTSTSSTTSTTGTTTTGPPLGACCSWGPTSDIDGTPQQTCVDQISAEACADRGNNQCPGFGTCGPSSWYEDMTCQDVIIQQQGCPTTLNPPTTTTPAPGACCSRQMPGGEWGCVDNVSWDQCPPSNTIDTQYNHYPGQTCAAVECGVTPTSTTAGGTTTTASGGTTTTAGGTTTTAGGTTTTAAPQTGACCCADYGTGGCQDLTEAQCSAVGGNYGGTGTNCAQVLCAPCNNTTTTANPGGGTTTTAGGGGGTTTTAGGGGTTAAGTTTTASGGGGTTTTASGTTAAGTTTTASGGGGDCGCDTGTCCEGETLVNVCCLYDMNGNLSQCQTGFSLEGCNAAGGQYRLGCFGSADQCECCPATDPNFGGP